MSVSSRPRVRRPVRQGIKGPRRSQAQPAVESLEVRALLSNLLVNGNFSQGNVGFTSQLDAVPIGGSHDGPGYYAVVHNPSTEISPIFANFRDHTTGTGLMLIADPSPTWYSYRGFYGLVPRLVWQETINVSQATDYTFSGWTASMGQYPIGTPVDPSPARLRVMVNGAQIGSDVSVPAQNGRWTPFTATWNSGTNDVARIEIYDENLDLTGNDFAVDDLSFRPAAEFIPPTTVIPPMGDIAPTVVGLQSSVISRPSSTLVVYFSQSMDAVLAEYPGCYRLVWAGNDGRPGTKDDRVIPVRGVHYDAGAQAVTLRLTHRRPLPRTLWLTVDGPTNAAGTPLAGGDRALRLDIRGLQTPRRMGLLPDGGFETPRLSLRNGARTLAAGNPALGSWRIASGSVNVQACWPGAEGRRTLDLNGTSAGTIERSFASVPGQVYQLQFDYGNNPDAGAGEVGATVTVTGVGLLLDEDFAHAGSTPRDLKFTRFFGTFLADSATTTLRIASTTPGAYGIVLDAVSVTPVPGVADVTPPVIQLNNPAPAVPVSQNPTSAGRVSDDGTGVALLEARVDSGPFQPVTLDASGQFTFATTLATDGTADGSHSVSFRATDRSGNVSPLTKELFTIGSTGVFDAGGDFSLASNPNGAWSYGYESSLGSTFHLYNATITDPDGNTGLVQWYDPSLSGNHTPTVGLNTASTDSPLGMPATVTVPGHQVFMHPGPASSGNQLSVLRWTAPAARTYQVSASFRGDDYAYPTTTGVHVLHNGASLFDGGVYVYGPATSYSGIVSVHAGDTLDFVVDIGADGSYTGDTTGLIVTIWAILSTQE